MLKLHENIFFSQKEYQGQLSYWEDKLKGELQPVSFPYTDIDKEIDIEGKYIKKIEKEIPYDVTKAITKISNNSDITMFVLLTAVLEIIIYKYTGNRNIMVAAPILKKEKAGGHNDLVILKDYIDSDNTFKDVLINAKDTLRGAYKNKDYPIELILKRLFHEKELTKLTNVGVLMRNIHDESVEKECKFDIVFSFTKFDDYILVTLSYKYGFIHDKEAENILEKYINVLGKAIADINLPIKYIDMLSEQERKNIIYNFNNTKVFFRRDKSIVEIFETVAGKFQDKVAVVTAEENLTYRELDERSNQLARLLLKKGIKKGDIVAIVLQPCTDILVSILSVLKVGAAYLPLEANTPDERLKYIFLDSNVSGVISKKEIIEKYKVSIDTILLDEVKLSKEESSSVNIKTYMDDVIYVIYTSGTTGKPKGVQVKNRGLVNYVNWFSDKAKLKPNDKGVLVSSFSFDLGYTTLYSSILNGTELHILNKERYSNPSILLEYIENQKITFMKTTPSLFSTIARTDKFNDIQCFNTVRLVVLGGEMINLKDVERLNKNFPNTKVFNHYGPTETTIGAISCQLDFNAFDKYKRIPVIGKPIDNTNIYVLDLDKNPTPVGIPGEIYISGEGLAKGYVNNKKLTDEKFVKNPFVEGLLMYKTNDMGRFVKDGTIEFLGRMDNQVKIRGYRVEVEEIQRTINSYEKVKESLVLVKENKEGDKFLCAYLVADNLTVMEIREYLSKHLPDYMIPAYFIAIERMPLTLNGKVDYKLLPEVERSIDTGVMYVKPRNHMEEKMCLVWEEILGIKTVGIQDGFFALGGDSIKAIQVSSRLQKYNIELDLKDLMKYQTIEELSTKVKAIKVKSSQEVVIGEVQLTPIQRRFFLNKFNGQNHWNQAVMLFKEDGFDELIVKKVFGAIVDKHDALRMIYSTINNEIIQFNQGIETAGFDIEVFNLKGLENVEEAIRIEEKKIQASINIEKGPLVKLGLFKTDNGDHLLIAIHHLVVDGVSLRIIFEDFTKGYLDVLKNEQIELGEKTDAYKLWAENIKNYAQSEELIREKPYWQKIEDTETVVLPKDRYFDQDISNKDNELVILKLSVEETDSLVRKVHKPFNTSINDILLVSLGRALKAWTKQEHFIINLEGHGREKIIQNVNVNGTVGWFTSIYPFHLDMSIGGDLAVQIKNVKESLKRVPKKGIGYGILKYLTEDKYKKDLVFRLNPEICFNYLGQFDQDIDNSLFKLSHIPCINTLSEEAKRQYTFHINCMIKNDSLEIYFDYSKNQYNHETVQSLADLYHASIKESIHYCTTNSSRVLTPSDLTYDKLSIYDLDNLQAVWKGKNLIIKDVYQLSPMQKVMIKYTTLCNGISPYYNNRVFTINGDMDIELIKEAYSLIVQKYDILRTLFYLDNERIPLQVVFEHGKSEFYYEDISMLDKYKKEVYFREIMKSDALKGFDLTKDFLMRLNILKLDSETYKVIWSNHHSILDGWSRMLILKDFFETIKYLKKKESLQNKKYIQYSEYIKWLNKQDTYKVLDYWKTVLDEYKPKSLLKKDIDEKQGEYVQESISIVIDEVTTTKLKEIAKDNNTTLNIVFQGMWAVLLQKLSNENDIVFGSIVSGRIPSIPNVESIIGPLFNIIPVRVNDNKIAFDKCLRNLQKLSTDSQNYSLASIEELQGFNDNESLIDNVMFFENYPMEDSIKQLCNKDKTISDVEFLDQGHYDFNIFILPFDNTKINISYNSKVYKKDTVEKILHYYVDIIEQVLQNPKVKIEDLQLRKHSLVL